MPEKVRAKFSCNSIEENYPGYKTVRFTAIYGTQGENKDFTDATPCGTIEIGISGDVPAANFFQEGKCYYLDFSEAPEQ